MMKLRKVWASSTDFQRPYLKSLEKITIPRCLDIAGVASSILATPTIKNPVTFGFAGFLLRVTAGVDWFG
jgi:hypothetical protein